MDPNRVEGTGRELGGKFRSWWGRLTGRTQDRVGGAVDQGVGRVQSGYGRLKDELRAEDQRQQEPPPPPPPPFGRPL
jgi:uncharacterized protein YjbJ (UPF0337 family)